MNKKFLLLLLTSASTQMHGMEQFVTKLKTKVRRTYYRVDKLWEEALEYASECDDYNQNGYWESRFVHWTEWVSSTKCKKDFECIENRLSEFYGKRVAFERSAFMEKEIKRVQSEFEESRKE